MDQGYSVNIVFFGLILSLSLGVFACDSAAREGISGRKRPRVSSGDTLLVEDSLASDDEVDGHVQMRETSPSMSSFSKGCSKGSSRSTSPDHSCHQNEWNCDMTLAVVGYVPVNIVCQRNGTSVRHQYSSLLTEQRTDLLQRFCAIIGNSRSVLSEHMRRYTHGLSLDLPTYEHSSRLQQMNVRDVYNQVTRELPGESLIVNESSEHYPGDNNVLLAIFGQNIKIYPRFFQVSLSKQLAEVRTVIENIRANNPFLLDGMHRCIVGSQAVLPEDELAKARSLFQEMRYFCTRGAVIKGFFAETRDDVRADLMQIGQEAPINYMKELVSLVEQEERVNWEWLTQEDQLKRDCATSWQSNRTIVDEYPGIPIAWAIKIIVARGQYRMRQRDMARAEKARQALLAQQLMVANSVQKKRASRAKK